MDIEPLKAPAMGIIRHLLTAAGGGFATSGAVSSEQWQLVVGAVMTLIGVVWSIAEKKIRES